MSSRGDRKRSRKHRFHHRTLPGAPPGILVPDLHAPRPAVRVMAYGPDGCVEEDLRDVASLHGLLARWPVTWVNVDGLGDTTVVSEIGKVFGFHPLALEDVVHVHQRAKVEQYPGHYFIVARMPMPRAANGAETAAAQSAMETEQASIFFGKNFVVTFQERPGGDCLEPVRVRIRTGMSRLRATGPDRLVAALLDAIVDHYFPLLEESGDRLDAVEDEVLERPVPHVMGHIMDTKRELLVIRRAVWPLREAINTLLRDPTPLISDETRLYLRDCHDHTIQIIELLENYRDITSGLTDVYLSSVSNRTNEIMRVLTVFSTIFIPLTFIAGVWGMNFQQMPELRSRWGYPSALVLMAIVAGGLLLFFRRKGWLGSGKRGQEP